MLMVVVLHILGRGDVLASADQLSLKYSVALLLESLAYCAVNCYALISGYVYISSKYKFSSLFQILAQALLYSLGIAVCVWIIKPETFSVGSLLSFAFPVSQGGYWYLSAYVGLFVLIPLLNAAINTFSREKAKILLCVLFFAFTIVPTFGRGDPFYLNSGYSTLWLAFLYVIGACIRKYGWGDSLKSYHALLIYILCAVVSWGIKLCTEGVTTWLLGEEKTVFLFITYTSPTMVIGAVMLFLAFKNAAVSPKLTGFISEFAPAAFGVYLIHEHEYIRRLLISDRFAFLSESSIPIMVVGVLVSAAGIFAACIFVDWIRCKVFIWLRIKENLEKLEEKYISCYIKSMQ